MASISQSAIYSKYFVKNRKHSYQILRKTPFPAAGMSGQVFEHKGSRVIKT